MRDVGMQATVTDVADLSTVPAWLALLAGIDQPVGGLQQKVLPVACAD